MASRQFPSVPEGRRISELDDRDFDGRLTPSQVARVLRRFGVRPRTLRFGRGRRSETAKGYERADFEDAWSRYVP
jgi:hypothetical protein